MPRISYILLLTLVLAICFSGSRQVYAQENPSILIVTAHPDDDAMFAATVYRITHALDGQVDLALITDGAGGYRFSTLAEDIYNLKLTDPAIAKTYLPAIRKQELMAGGSIIGIRNYFFLDQPDEGKTENADSVMQYVWDVGEVSHRMDVILKRGKYDFVFTMLPIKPFHAHHKAATIFALEAVERLPEDRRPIILGSFTTGGADEVVAAFEFLEGHPLTRIRKDVGPFTFARDTPVGLDGRLNYNIIVNWLIAEHKSQGTMQLYMTHGNTVERFWLYSINPESSVRKTDELFRRVNDTQ